MKKIKFLFLGVFLMVFLSKTNFALIYSTVSGKVIDEETGKGIKDVNIVLCIFGNSWREVKSTDVNGEFNFSEVLSGQGEIGFYPSYTYAWLRSWEKRDLITVEEGKNVYILKKLKSGGIIEVKIIDKKSNSPIEGVKLFVPQEYPGLHIELYENFSNNQGIIKRDRLYPGKYDLNFWRTGYWFKEIKGVEVRSKEITKVELFYDDENPKKIQGRITCKQDGLPLKDVSVTISLKNSEKYWADTFTDSNGYYAMSDFVPGLYTITILGIKKISDENTENIKIEKDILLDEKDKTYTINFNVDCTLDYEKWEE
jgi:5-hydroxyisourate hydrolase-like protein (transthyretin family)